MSKLLSLWVVLCFLVVFGFWKGLRGCRMFYYAVVLPSVFASLRGFLFPLPPIEGIITTLYFARFSLTLLFLFGLVSKSPSEDVTTAVSPFALPLFLFSLSCRLLSLEPNSAKAACKFIFAFLAQDMG